MSIELSSFKKLMMIAFLAFSVGFIGGCDDGKDGEKDNRTYSSVDHRPLRRIYSGTHVAASHSARCLFFNKASTLP